MTMKEYKYNIAGKEYIVHVGERTDNVTTVTVNGDTYNVEAIPEPAVEKKPVIAPVAVKKTETKDDLQDALRSPLPGTVLEIVAKVGDEVKEDIVYYEACHRQKKFDQGKLAEILREFHISLQTPRYISRMLRRDLPPR